MIISCPKTSQSTKKAYVHVQKQDARSVISRKRRMHSRRRSCRAVTTKTTWCRTSISQRKKLIKEVESESGSKLKVERVKRKKWTLMKFHRAKRVLKRSKKSERDKSTSGKHLSKE